MIFTTTTHEQIGTNSGTTQDMSEAEVEAHLAIDGNAVIHEETAVWNSDGAWFVQTIPLEDPNDAEQADTITEALMMIG